jgi:Sodium Bile acid symporter family
MACRRSSVIRTTAKLDQLFALSSLLIVSALCIETCSASINGSVASSLSLPALCSFSPERVNKLPEGYHALVTVNCTAPGARSSPAGHIILQLNVSDSNIVSIVGDHVIVCEFGGYNVDNVTSNCSFALRGLFLGRTVIRISYMLDTSDNVLQNRSSDILAFVEEYHVSVVRKERIIDHVFLGLVTLMVIFANIGMGCKIELDVVKEVLIKPIAPVIGFCCQYVIMPLVSILLILVLLSVI